MRAFLFLISASFFLAAFSGYGQIANNDLEERNKNAFTAFENGADNAYNLAQEFVETASGTASVYEVNAYTLLGILNKDRGFYISAVNNHLNALNAAEALKDDGRVSACLNNIGSVYQLQQNYEKGKEFFLKSLAIEDSLDQPLQRSIRYYNLGEVYKEQDSLEIALTYYNNSLRIEQKFNNREGIVYALLGIAEVYLSFDRLTEATIEIEKINSLLEDSDIEEKIMFHYLNGKLLLKKDQFQLAIASLDHALSIANSKSFIIHNEEILESKVAALEGTGDFKAMAQTLKALLALKKELNSVAIKNQLDDLTYQNELNKKELEIALVKEERDLAKHNEELKEEITGFSAKIIWFLVASIVGIFLFVIYGIKRLSN